MDAQSALKELAGLAWSEARLTGETLPGFHEQILEFTEEGFVRSAQDHVAVVHWDAVLDESHLRSRAPALWTTLREGLTFGKRDPDKLARAALVACLMKIQTGTTSLDGAAEQTWLDAVRFGQQDTVAGWWIAPLLNLRTEDGVDIVHLGDGASISRSTSAEKHRYWNQPRRPTSRFSTGGIDAFNWVSRWSSTLRISVDELALIDRERWADVRPRVDGIITALRLLDGGSVDTPLFWPELDSRDAPFESTLDVMVSGSMFFRAETAHYRGAMTLSKEAVSEFPIVLQRLQDTEGTDRAFDLAIRRFDSAYARVAPEDRLIDYWVALEALFTKRNESAISYRATSRIARFIGVDQQERLALRETMRLSYDARSDVVHGTAPDDMKKKIKDRGLDAITDDTEVVLRRALRAWIDPARSHDLQVIDNAMML